MNNLPPQSPQGPVVPPVVPPVDPPVDPPTDDDTTTHTDHSDHSDTESECEPEECVPHFVPMTLEIVPKIKLCVDKPIVHLKNNAVCICKPCKKKNKA